MTRREPASSLPLQLGDTDAAARIRQRADARMAAWRRSHRFPAQGWVLYDGPSLITGERVLVILTGLKGRSTNAKTGDLLKAYILTGEHPGTMVKQGRDASVCGDCVHRPATGGRCYVNAGWAASNIWTAHDRGVYAPLPDDARQQLAGAAVRVGAWGDPAAVPVSVWRPLLDDCDLVTGYTHLWAGLDVETWGWLMASVDSATEAASAQALGWRTFRVLAADEPAPETPGVRECLVAQGLHCLSCRGCDGVRPRTNPSRGFWVRAHGHRVTRPRKSTMPSLRDWRAIPLRERIAMLEAEASANLERQTMPASASSNVEESPVSTPCPSHPYKTLPPNWPGCATCRQLVRSALNQISPPGENTKTARVLRRFAAGAPSSWSLTEDVIALVKRMDELKNGRQAGDEDAAPTVTTTEAPPEEIPEVPAPRLMAAAGELGREALDELKAEPPRPVLPADVGIDTDEGCDDEAHLQAHRAQMARQHGAIEGLLGLENLRGDHLAERFWDHVRHKLPMDPSFVRDVLTEGFEQAALPALKDWLREQAGVSNG